MMPKILFLLLPWLTGSAMLELDMTLAFSDIEVMTEDNYKKLCKEKVIIKAFQYLQNKKQSHKSLNNIKYERLEMAHYLRANSFDLTVKDRQFLFQCRTNDIDAKANRTWRYEDITCVSCKDLNQIETGKHILECSVLQNQNNIISYIPDYNDLYSTEVQEQIYVSQVINENMKLRKKYLPTNWPL